MDKTVFMVFWVHETGGPASGGFDNMSTALAFMQELRKDSGNKFIAMASESEDNVGKMGVGAVVDGKCPDGGDFLGRLSRHGMLLKRGR